MTLRPKNTFSDVTAPGGGDCGRDVTVSPPAIKNRSSRGGWVGGYGGKGGERGRPEEKVSADETCY